MVLATTGFAVVALAVPAVAAAAVDRPKPTAAAQCERGIDTAACRAIEDRHVSGVRLRREADQLTFMRASDAPGVDVAFSGKGENRVDDGDAKLVGSLFPDSVTKAGSFTGTITNAANQTFDFAVATAPSVSGTIAAVPEPAGWATMILGVGLLGGVLRRRIRLSEARFAEKLRRIEAGESL